MNNQPIKVTQILYTGLGGHGAVAFSFVDASMKEEGICNSLIFYGIEPVREEYEQQCKTKKIPFAAILKKKGFDLGSYKAVFKSLRTLRPDVVLLHSVVLIHIVYVASLLFRFRIIAVEHQANHLKQRSDWLASRLCLLLANKVVYLTNSYKEQIREKAPLFFRSRKVRVIPNGIDVSYFTSCGKKDSSPFYYGMISRVNSIKDHSTLIEAFALIENKNSYLIIAGDGPSLQELKIKAEQCDVAERVLFPGLLQGEDVPKFYNKINVYVHASLGETMSTSIMQAMSCGLPVIASDVDGINNMITDGLNGILVPVKDPALLAARMQHLMKDPIDRDKIAVNAREFALSNFSNEKMFDGYMSLITDQKRSQS